MNLWKIIRFSFPVFLMMWHTRCKKKKIHDVDQVIESEALGEDLAQTKEEVEDKILEDTQAENVTENSSIESIEPILDEDNYSCREGQSKVSLDKIKEAGESLDVNVFVYGSQKSAIVALDFPKYQYEALEEIFLSDGNGNLIAQRGISESSDVQENRKLNILFFDHIWLEDVKRITVIYRTMEGYFFKRSMSEDFKFMNTFRGVDIVNLSQTNFNHPDYFDRHVENIFVPDERQFSEGGSKIDIYQKSRFDTRYLNNESWAETIVTDLSGKVIEEHGENFRNLGSNTIFIVYRLMKRKYFFRTFVRVA